MQLFIIALFVGVSSAAQLQYGQQAPANAQTSAGNGHLLTSPAISFTESQKNPSLQSWRHEKIRKLLKNQHSNLLRSSKIEAQPEGVSKTTSASNTEPQGYFYLKPSAESQPKQQIINENKVEDGYYYTKPSTSFIEEPKDAQNSSETPTVDYFIEHGYHYPKPTGSHTETPPHTYSTTKKPVSENESSQHVSGYYYVKPTQPLEYPETINNSTSITEQYPPQSGYYYPKPNHQKEFKKPTPPTKVPTPTTESSSSHGYYYPKPSPSFLEKPKHIQNENQISNDPKNANEQEYIYPKPLHQLIEESNIKPNQLEADSQTEFGKNPFVHSNLPVENLQSSVPAYSVPNHNQYIMIPILIDHPSLSSQLNSQLLGNQGNLQTYPHFSVPPQYQTHQGLEEDAQINTQLYRTEGNKFPDSFVEYIHNNRDQEIQQQYVSPQQISEEAPLLQKDKDSSADSLQFPQSGLAAKSNAVVPILDYQNNPNVGAGSYNFQYSTGNGIQQQEQGHQVDDVEHVIHGTYTYSGPNNKIYTVTYKADATGFHVSGAHLPIQPVSDEDKARIWAYKGPTTEKPEHA